MACSYWLAGVVVVLLACWQSGLADDGLPASIILARFEALEKQGLEHRALLTEQKTELDELTSVVHVQSQTIKEQQLIIEELLEWKRKHEAREPVHQTKQEDSGIQAPDNFNKRRGQHKATNRMFKDLSRVGRLLVEDVSPVAFHAVISNNTEVFNLGAHQKVVFDVVKLNIGGGYHNQHGLFIAPAPGLYIFSLSIMASTHNNDYLDVGIVRNGEILGAVYAHGDQLAWDQGSVTIVVQLAAADEVWVDHRYGVGQSVWGNYYSSFMGCLLFPV